MHLLSRQGRSSKPLRKVSELVSLKDCADLPRKKGGQAIDPESS